MASPEGRITVRVLANNVDCGTYWASHEETVASFVTSLIGSVPAWSLAHLFVNGTKARLGSALSFYIDGRAPEGAVTLCIPFSSPRGFNLLADCKKGPRFVSDGPITTAVSPHNTFELIDPECTRVCEGKGAPERKQGAVEEEDGGAVGGLVHTDAIVLAGNPHCDGALELPARQAAANDALSLCDALEHVDGFGVDDENVHAFLGSSATLDNLRRALVDVTRGPLLRNRLVVYLSGRIELREPEEGPEEEGPEEEERPEKVLVYRPSHEDDDVIPLCKLLDLLLTPVADETMVFMNCLGPEGVNATEVVDAFGVCDTADISVSLHMAQARMVDYLYFPHTSYVAVGDTVHVRRKLGDGIQAWFHSTITEVHEDDHFDVLFADRMVGKRVQSRQLLLMERVHTKAALWILAFLHGARPAWAAHSVSRKSMYTLADSCKERGEGKWTALGSQTAAFFRSSSLPWAFGGRVLDVPLIRVPEKRPEPFVVREGV